MEYGYSRIYMELTKKILIKMEKFKTLILMNSYPSGGIMLHFLINFTC